MTGRADDEGRTPATNESVKVTRDGHVVAEASVSALPEPEEPAKVALSAPRDVAPTGARGELVDQVMDHPAVQGSDNVHVVLPLGDTESISRLQERTTNFTARAAGASSVVEAEVVRPDPEA